MLKFQYESEEYFEDILLKSLKEFKENFEEISKHLQKTERKFTRNFRKTERNVLKKWIIINGKCF